LEDLCNLLFELSNEDRVEIFNRLNEEAMNISTLAKKLSLTNQECSRHISRLSTVGLIKRDDDGRYHPNLYGDLIIKQLDGIIFSTKHREYFTTHSIANLPLEFIERMGELSGSIYAQDQMVAISRIEAMMREAEEYIWILHDQYFMGGYSIGAEALNRGVEIRSIDPKIYNPPTQLRGEVSDRDRKTINDAVANGLCKLGTLKKINIFLQFSEKEAALIAFPTVDGKFDYLGFGSSDERVLKWCKDVFKFYWDKIEPKYESNFGRAYKHT